MLLITSFIILLLWFSIHIIAYSMVLPFTPKKQLRSVVPNGNMISFSRIQENAKFENQKTSINSGINDINKNTILYYDEDIIVVNKPCNLQTVPGFHEDLSIASVMKDLFKISNVEHMTPHRLDYQTSGLLVLTRNVDALKSMQAQFRNDSSIYKRYVAIVKGKFNDMEGEIDLPIGKDTLAGPPCQTIDYQGKHAITIFKVDSFNKYNTKVNLIPLTGRTHQLRLHMAASGHEILGDLFYASQNAYRASTRLLLHANELRCRHPKTNIDMKFIAPCPFQLNDYCCS